MSIWRDDLVCWHVFPVCTLLSGEWGFMRPWEPLWLDGRASLPLHPQQAVLHLGFSVAAGHIWGPWVTAIVMEGPLDPYTCPKN